MRESIIGTRQKDFQLIMIGIDLIHNIFSIIDCSPELISNPHVAIAHECAVKWNETFIDLFTKEGN